jgi:hypothetical protein
MRRRLKKLKRPFAYLTLKVVPGLSSKMPSQMGVDLGAPYGMAAPSFEQGPILGP